MLFTKNRYIVYEMTFHEKTNITELNYNLRTQSSPTFDNSYNKSYRSLLINRDNDIKTTETSSVIVQPPTTTSSSFERSLKGCNNCN